MRHESAAVHERLSVHLIEALARVWSRIRSLHPSVPGVVLLAAPASRESLRVLGHFAALRWQARKKDGAHFHEVVVIAEYLDRPAEAIVETLIHEAAHAMNFELGLYDCSASQYHNRLFRTAAESLGLEVAPMPHYGFAATSLPDRTAARYRAEIETLKEVLIHRRSLQTTGPGPRPPRSGSDGDEDRPRSRSRKATCACPHIIRASRKTLSETTIRCESCGEAFRMS
jgi:hypothetical protein